MFLNPFQPVRPPAAVVVLRVVVPGTRIAAQPVVLDIVGFGVAWRVENALHMAAVGQHETPVAAQQQGRAVHRVPWRDVIVDAGDAEAVYRDFLQVDWRTADFQPTGMTERVVLEEVQQVTVQRGGEARGVVVPVQNVERRRRFAQQIIVDPVRPDQVIGAHPGKYPAHLAAFQYASLVGAALGGFQCLFIDEQRGRAIDLAVQQADHVGRAGNTACLAFDLQVAQQRGDGQTACASAHQIDLTRAADRPADIHRLLGRLDITGQPPFAMTDIRVAPTDDECRQAVLEGVLHKAVGRAEIEDVVLVDLRWHDQYRSAELLLAHRPVLDQFEHFVTEHHRAGCGRHGPSYLESVLGGLAGQAVVVQQVIGHVAQAFEQAGPAGVEQLFDGLRVEQGIGRGQRVVDQREQKMRAGPVLCGQVAVIDPLPDLMLATEINLQPPAIKRVQAPGRVGEAAVLWVVRIKGFAQQHHAPQLAAQCQSVAGAANRMPPALRSHITQGRKQVSSAHAGYGALRVDKVRRRGRDRGSFRWFFLHEGNTPSSGNSWVGASLSVAKGLRRFARSKAPM
ncbi:Uncharacterized protein AC506_1899 [Pseudomonas syringae pv. maculicola str. M6]|nr:Uncharacterized protein AC506_1899 [Pseudomonas syringae pv. maculicola str. M6]